MADGITAQQAEPRRILIADDDETIRGVLREWLELEGYAVRETPCGRDVVAVVCEWEPDCVLLDLLMIPVDGLKVLRDLQEAGLTPGVPVILLSAFLAEPAQASLRQQLQARGARGWMGKPIEDFDALKRLIDHPPEPPDAPWLGDEGD